MTLPEPDGLLFDLDGTLVESMPDLRDALDGALKHHGGVGVQTEQILNWIGDGVRTLVARGVSQSVEPSTDEALCEQVHHTFRVMYLESCCRKSYLLSGVRELLDEAQLRGLPMAICTNKDDIYTMPLLLHLDLLKYFSVVKCPGPTVARKPDADMLHQAMQELGIERPWMMGDSRADAFAAKNAGVPCILRRGGYDANRSLEDYGVELVVDEVSQITERLRGSLAIS